MPPEIVGEHLEPDRLYDAVNVLLSLQVIIKYALVHQFCETFLLIHYINFVPLAIKISEQKWWFSCLGACRGT